MQVLQRRTRSAERDGRSSSKAQAGQLLLETAGLLEEGNKEEMERMIAAPEVVEMVELCGRLPLTVAIAGGVVGNYGAVDREVVELLREMANVDFRVLQRGRPSETDPEGHQ